MRNRLVLTGLILGGPDADQIPRDLMLKPLTR
ncbi:MAG: hypothetical protein QOF91_1806 [Alphaproteobacteria bacterium]|jgi:hypothetical protein|nr:hypothetical protein [Alphaproteobacteria bacterium]